MFFSHASLIFLQDTSLVDEFFDADDSVLPEEVKTEPTEDLKLSGKEQQSTEKLSEQKSEEVLVENSDHSTETKDQAPVAESSVEKKEESLESEKVCNT